MVLHEQNVDRMDEVTGLPVPDATALEHSERLAQSIRREIEQHDGHIGFDRYMEMALYEPGLGYYSAGSGKFGGQGDFVTAPEISPLFSFCLARQCNQVLDNLEEGSILELGAGTGRMASDMLQELKRIGGLPARYLILETSADLRQRQQQLLQETLPDYFNRIEWLERLPDKPLSGVILANEVLDALPVHRVVLRDNLMNELHVACRDGNFSWTEVAGRPPLQEQMQHIAEQLPYEWPDGYTTEINTAVSSWITTLADVLMQGVMLLIDYGYARKEFYHPQRADGTLLCHYRHRVHANPFVYPGLQDITASVEFTTVAETAAAAGLKVKGFTTQAFFLAGCGLEEIFASRGSHDQRLVLELANQVKLLTLPGEMGERFKVIGLTRNFEPGLMGFTTVDQRRHL